MLADRLDVRGRDAGLQRERGVERDRPRALVGDRVGEQRGLDLRIVAGPAERMGAGGTGTSVYFRDPDGSLLEFIAYSSAERLTR